MMMLVAPVTTKFGTASSPSNSLLHLSRSRKTHEMENVASYMQRKRKT